MGINYLNEEKKLFKFLSKKLPKLKYINLDNSIIPKKYKSNKVQINYNNDESIWFFRFSVKNKDFFYCFGLKDENQVKLILKVNEDRLKSSLNFFSNDRIGIEIKFDKNYKKTFKFLNENFTLRKTTGSKKRFFIMIVNDNYSDIIKNITKVINLVNFNFNLEDSYLLTKGKNEKHNQVNIQPKNSSSNTKSNFDKLDFIKNFKSNINNSKNVHSSAVKSKSKIKKLSTYNKQQKSISNNDIKTKKEIKKVLPSKRENISSTEDIIKENFPFKSPWENQLELISQIMDAIKEGYKNIILESGPGKSGIAATLAKIYNDSYILTASEYLQNKYIRDFGWKNNNNIVVRSYDVAFDEFKSTSEKKRKLLIMDDAHKIEENIVNSFSRRFDLVGVVNDLESEIPDIENSFKLLNNKRYDSWLKFFKLLSSKYIKLINSLNQNSENYTDVLTNYNELCEIIKYIEENHNLYCSYSDNSYFFGVSFKPINVDKIVNKYLLNNGEICIFMSSSILNIKTFVEDFGIDINKTKFIHKDPAFDVNKTHIFTREAINMDKRFRKENINLTIPIIQKILNKHENEKGLIYVGNSDNKNFIMNNINDKRLITHGYNDYENKIQLFKKSNDLVLVSESMHEDFDFLKNQCKFQIIFKHPVDSWDNRAMRKNQLKPYWYDYRTAINLVNMFNKTVRTKYDYCETYMLDDAFLRFVTGDIEETKFIPQYYLNSIIDADLSNPGLISDNIKMKFGVYYLFDYAAERKLKIKKYGENTIELSKKILKYKNYEKEFSNRYKEEFNFFTKELMKSISEFSNQVIGDEIDKLALICVPSSTVNRDNSATIRESIKSILKWQNSGESLSKFGCSKEIIDCRDLLKRISDVNTGHKTDNRPSYGQHMDSIKCVENKILEMNNVAFIVMDDITTRGTIMNACEDILVENGVNRDNIYKFALFRTLR